MRISKLTFLLLPIALKLAMRLRQPRNLRTVVEQLISSESGTAQLHEAVSSMEIAEIAHCLACARDWNSTATHALTAQKLLHAVLKATPASSLSKVPKLDELLDALIPYTERHFERYDRLLQSASFLSYTLAAMRSVDASDGQAGASGAAVVGVTFSVGEASSSSRIFA